MDLAKHPFLMVKKNHFFIFVDIKKAPRNPEGFMINLIDLIQQ